MSLYSKKLHYRKNGATTDINLYTASSDVSSPALCLRDGSTILYAKLASSGTDLCVRKNGTVYHVQNYIMPPPKPKISYDTLYFVVSGSYDNSRWMSEKGNAWGPTWTNVSKSIDVVSVDDVLFFLNSSGKCTRLSFRARYNGGWDTPELKYRLPHSFNVMLGNYRDYTFNAKCTSNPTYNTSYYVYAATDFGAATQFMNKDFLINNITSMRVESNGD